MTADSLGGMAVLLGTGLVLAWASVCVWTAWVLTHPPRRTYASALAKGRPGEPGEVRDSIRWTKQRVASRGVSLEAWTIEGDDPSAPTLVMTHGWADGKVGGLVRLEAVLPQCSRVIAWDMPGHGESGGGCRLGLVEADALLAVIDTLAPDDDLVLLGWSMGAGISIDVARSLDRVAGVVAEAPYRSAFTPAQRVLESQGLPWRATLWPALLLVGLTRGRGPRWMLRGSPFDRARIARELRCPLLVLHGDLDSISPTDDGMAIAEAAPGGSFRSIEGATHNGMWTVDGTAPAAGEAVGSFLQQLEGGGSTGDPA
ncbi:MAG: alpha/beta fold hydrolase [Planctomycetota bacterium]